VAEGGEFDGRTDIYALGTVLYEGFCGEPPFEGDTTSVLYRIAHELPLAPSARGAKISEGLERAVLHCLEKSPAKRPQRAGDVARELASCRDALSEELRRSIVGTREITARIHSRQLGRLVGRSSEFGEIQHRLNSALAGECHLVLVGGEPGVGKTRLLEEVDKLASIRKATVLHGRFLEAERSFAYDGFCEAIQEYFQKRTLSSPAIDFSDLASDLVALFPILGETASLRAALGESGELARAADPQRSDDRTRVFDLLARVLMRIAAGRPLVLLLEDLNAADRSLDALQYVVRRLGATPVLIVGSWTTTEVDRAHPLNTLVESFHGDRRFLSVSLGPLSEDDHRALVEAALGATKLESGIAAQLYGVTEGNPYFAKELVRSLVDSRDIVQNQSGEWRLAGGGIPAEALPATIQQAVQKRLHRVSDSLRDLLATAAVLGRSFELRDLEAVAGGDVEIDDEIDELIELGLLEEARERRSDRLSFSSAMLRDVVYGDVARRRRKSLHRKIAEHLERRHASRLDGVHAQLVHHFAEADDGEKVVDYALRYARSSMERSSPEEAIRAARSALDFLEESDDDAVEAHALLGGALQLAGSHAPALKELETAIRIAIERRADADRLLDLVTNAAECSWEGRDIDAAQRWIEQGIALLACEPERADRDPRRLLTLAMTVHSLRGDFVTAQHYGERLEKARGERSGTARAATPGGVLRVPLVSRTLTLDPMRSRLVDEGELFSNVFEPLITTDGAGNLVPALCERWEADASATRFRFRIREGLRRHDGTPVGAVEIKRCLEDAIRRAPADLPAALSPILGAQELADGRSDGVVGLRVTVDQELEIELVEPVPIYLSLLTDIRMRLAFGEAGSLEGTGPFRFDSVGDDTIRLTRNEGWWRGETPLVEAIEFQPGMSPSGIAAAFSAGELDIARDLKASDLESVIGDRRLHARLLEVPKKSSCFVVWKRASERAGDELRRALFRSVRVHDLVRRTLGREAQPANGLVPPGVFAHDAGARRNYLPAEAVRALLDQSATAAPLELRAAVLPFCRERYPSTTEALFGFWRGLGVAVTDATPDNEAFLAASGDATGFDLLMVRWTADFDDPDSFFGTVFHSKLGMFREFLSEPWLDRAIDEAKSETHPGRRERLYHNLESRLIDDGLVLPLFHEIDCRVVQPWVHDVELRPNEPFVNYESLWRTEPVREERAARKSGGAIHCPIQHLVESLDPAPQFHLWYSEVQLNIFETLTRVFEGARLVPWLASSVESEEAGERLRIRLRDDVRFHDGRRLTARDVRATFERVLRLRGSLNRWLLSPIRGADEMIRGEADQLEGLRIVNAHELVLELVEPVAGFAAVFAHNSLAIVPEGTTTIGTSWKEGCLGTGPFRATRFEPAKRLDLEANPHYWRPGFPRAESLSFTFGVKPSEIAEKFRSGRYSLAWDLVPEDLVALRRDPELRAQYRETPRLSTYFVVFNCHRGPFSDESLRRRFAAAIDADALVQQHLGRVAIRADGLLPPGLAGHERVSRARGAAEPPASPRLALSLG
jgi:ABC-type transport system substrate-binding protein/tetratricopeptide (TPR) repeat protein